MGFSKFEVTTKSLGGPGNKKSEENTDIYKPDVSKAKDGKYVALLKLLPNMIDPSNMVMGKYVTWLGDPTSPNATKKPVDNPNSIGDYDNPINTLRSDLYNTKDPEKIAVARDFLGTTSSYYCFVQIVQDDVDPSLNGQIKLFRFGKKISEKIYDEVDEGNNPFDLVNGKLFQLCITKTYTAGSKSAQNNYDRSKFLYTSTISTGYRYFGPDGKMYIASQDDPNAEYIERQLIEAEKKFDLSVAYFQPWDEETKVFVADRCRMIKEYVYPELMKRHNTQYVDDPQKSFVPTMMPTQQYVQPPTGDVANATDVKPVSFTVPKVAEVRQTDTRVEMSDDELMNSGFSTRDLNFDDI